MPRTKQEVPWLDWRDGVAYVFWSVPGTVDPVTGKRSKAKTERLSLRTRDVDEATRRYAAFLTEGTTVYAAGSTGNSYLVTAALDLYKEKRVDPTDIDNPVKDKDRAYQAIDNLKAFFGPLSKTVVDVDIQDCRDYAVARRTGVIFKMTKGGKNKILAKNGTIRREINVLGAAMNHAAAWKKITGLGPKDIPVLEKPPTPKSKGLFLTRDELRKLRDCAEGRTRNFIDIAYWTGSRKEAVEQLTVFQLDIENNLLDLGYEGERDGTMETSVKRRPVITIPPEILPLLTRLKAEAVAAGTTYLLGHPGSTRTAFATAVKRAGLLALPKVALRPAGKPTPHILRHSRATHMLQQGDMPIKVANLLGDNVQTVIRVYGHHCPEYMKEQFGIKDVEQPA